MEPVVMTHNTPESRVPAGQRVQDSFDLDVSYLRWFALGILALIIVTAAAAYAMLGGFRVPHAGAAATRGAEGPSAEPFATLQSAPQGDLRSYRRSKATALEGYRWVDRAGGVVQIPIERAMEMIAAEGAAQAAPAAPQPEGGRR
jgi:hypothetical protein